MSKFAFIAHPPDLQSLYRYFFKAGVRRRPDALVEKVLEWTPSFKLADVRGIRSAETGGEIEGYLIVCPLLPKQFVELDEDLVLNKIVDGCQIAQDLGARIVGLGGFTSVVGEQGRIIAERVDIPVTTGNSYTVATVIDGILKAARDVEMDLTTATLAIIGATGSIGSACARTMVGRVRRLVLTARNRERLEELAEILRSAKKADVKTSGSPREAVSDADVVITTTSATRALISGEDLKPGAVVCDVAVPKNISEDVARTRKDVLLFEGGIVRPPGDVTYDPPVKLFDGFTYACVAEAMILALEDRFECFSLGRNLPLTGINEMLGLGQRHGFRNVMRSIGVSDSCGYRRAIRQYVQSSAET